MLLKDQSLTAFLQKTLDTLSFASADYGKILVALLVFWVSYDLLKRLKRGGFGMMKNKATVDFVNEQGQNQETQESDSASASDCDLEQADFKKQQILEKEERENEEKKENLEELFELDILKTKKQERIEKEQNAELETIEKNKEIEANLRQEVGNLVQEVACLMEKGLSKSYIAQTLASKSGQEVPLIELNPLIEALRYFINENEDAKQSVVIGVDPYFEQKSALSALMRGEYDQAIEFLETKVKKIKDTSVRSDVRAQTSQEKASLSKAIAVLARPVDLQKSFKALQTAKQYAPEDPLPCALIGRAYYESGKTSLAKTVFEQMTQETPEKKTYADEYALDMIPRIYVQETTFHANRIRKNYEERLGEQPTTLERNSFKKQVDLQKYVQKEDSSREF